MIERLFKLKGNNTNVKTEITAGITTFITMAYILAVNPGILGEAGMDPTAVLLATCIASFIGTACMAFMANMPFAVSVGIGLFIAFIGLQNAGLTSLTTAIPAYLCIIAMPLFYSISEGISLGVISYVIMNLVCGKRKDINPVMYVLAVLFILKYIFL